WQAYRTAMFQAASESEGRYRQLFEDSPISLWEQDMSAVKERLDELQRDGVTDLDAYLRENPDIVTGLIQRIKVLDVNQATLALLGADGKEQLLEALPRIIPSESFPIF